MLPVPERLTEGSFVVIFVSRLREDAPGYAKAAARLVGLVRTMPGFMGMASWRDEEGRGVTISWWRDLESIERWRDHPDHARARRRGDVEWYDDWHIEICRIDRIARKSSA
jgi:heme-degrading monooxygenase HmoA